MKPRGCRWKFHTSPKDGSEQDLIQVPALLGPLIVPGYTTYLEHIVKSGETLWKIATQHYGNGNLYHRLVAANPLVITNPNVIHVGDVLRVPRS